MKNKDARSLTPEKQEDLRKEAVNHVLKDGMTRGETAKLLKVSRQVVELWVKEYKKGGAVALRSGRKGRPQGWALKADQAQQIEKTIKTKTPGECGLLFSRWSRRAAAALIRKEYRVRVSVWTTGRYLKHWKIAAGKTRAQDPKEKRS